MLRSLPRLEDHGESFITVCSIPSSKNNVMNHPIPLERFLPNNIDIKIIYKFYMHRCFTRLYPNFSLH